jgi:glyoxylase-like metal-dependent hydrolase (beta-lactamase superfamily II)
MLVPAASLLLTLALGAGAGEALTVESRQMGSNTYYVEGASGQASRANRGFNSNAGFVVTNAGVVVFDALGTPALGRALLDEIRRHTTAPIQLLILSHYHADHVYGAEVFRAAGAKIWAFRGGQEYLRSDLARERLAERRQTLAPWIDADFRLPEPDRWLEADTAFEMAGVRFELKHVGPAHSPEDLAMLVLPDGVLFAGDLVYEGRIPFLGGAESGVWLAALDRLPLASARVLVPGHGPAARDAAAAMRLTRDYLADLRQKMRVAVAALMPFEEAFNAADWSSWSQLPAFAAAHRGNAYAVYLEMERESLQKPSV